MLPHAVAQRSGRSVRPLHLFRTSEDAVNEDGPDPDYRFTLANERTFLAWIRTALALVAGGVAVVQLIPEFAFPGARHVMGGTAECRPLPRFCSCGTSSRRSAASSSSRRTSPSPCSPCGLAACEVDAAKRVRGTARVAGW